jgi:polysaccharide export outer membrane protein
MCKMILRMLAALLVCACAPIAPAQTAGSPPIANSSLAALGESPSKPDSGTDDSRVSPDLRRRDARYRLCASDVVSVTFPLTPEFNQTVSIQPDGFASLAGAGDVRLEGLTTQESAEAVRVAYAQILTDPVVSIDLKDFNKPYFIVSGEVGHPGKFDLRGETSATEAIAIAGGFNDASKHSQVLLFRRVNNDWYEVKPLNLKRILQGHDVNEDPEVLPGDMLFVNLESALDAEDLPVRPPTGLGQNVSAPSASLEYLRAIRCGPVGCANNHNLDFQAAGAERTHTAIARSCMVPLGSGLTLRSAPNVFVWEGPGAIRVGFWAAAIASRDLATRSTVGVEPATLARATEAVNQLRSRGARLSIALIHAGCLRTNRADPAEANLIDAIARLGFCVAASHSHRISGARMIHAPNSNPVFCFYGLGSIASGYVASDLEREGLIVVVSLTSAGDLASVEVRPVILGASGFGEIPAPQTSDAILSRFRSLSGEIADGSSARLFYRDMSEGLVSLYLRDARAALRQSGLRGLARKARRMRMRHVKRLVRSVLP